MRLQFLDRAEEAARLRRLCARREGSLGVVYGRRRCGKSRLVREILPPLGVFHVADDRESPLQRASLAAEIARVLPGFDRVVYPEWAALFGQFWAQAPRGTVLALDEFPALVAVAPEVPSLLQKHVDHPERPGVHLLLAGSSQRMMHGLVLDRNAPLFGRAVEILRLRPLPCGWIRGALRLRAAVSAIEAYAVWGGIPRYWELASDHTDRAAAIRALVLSPLGVLHEEPASLLRDDLRDTTQAASILSVIGQGCHRLSEIAGRIGKPATSLSRPMQRLVDLDLVRRDAPFGVPVRDAKRTLYAIADPFLRFWFRFVEPNRSRLEARRADTVSVEIEREFPAHVGGVWEELARASVPALRCGGIDWKPAARWWGTGVDRRPLEIDVVAESEDGDTLLLGEAKWTRGGDAGRLLETLRRKAEQFPRRAGRRIALGVWVRERSRKQVTGNVYGPDAVLAALR